MSECCKKISDALIKRYGQMLTEQQNEIIHLNTLLMQYPEHYVESKLAIEKIESRKVKEQPT